jgi:effector-binding domain-containing protein
MPTTPRIIDRAAEPYVAIPATVTMQTIGETIGSLLGEVFGWLDQRELKPGGAPFVKYNVIDMERELEIEVGVPLAVPAAGNGRVRDGLLPAGQYAAMVHIGHYDGLVDATDRLLTWGEEQGLAWDRSEDSRRWGARLECYETDPVEEPDPANWRTELRFRLAG